jgi:hypothetical protein
MATVVALR